MEKYIIIDRTDLQAYINAHRSIEAESSEFRFDDDVLDLAQGLIDDNIIGIRLIVNNAYSSEISVVFTGLPPRTMAVPVHVSSDIVLNLLLLCLTRRGLQKFCGLRLDVNCVNISSRNRDRLMEQSITMFYPLLMLAYYYVHDATDTDLNAMVAIDLISMATIHEGSTTSTTLINKCTLRDFVLRGGYHNICQGACRFITSLLSGNGSFSRSNGLMILNNLYSTVVKSIKQTILARSTTTAIVAIYSDLRRILTTNASDISRIYDVNFNTSEVLNALELYARQHSMLLNYNAFSPTSYQTILEDCGLVPRGNDTQAVVDPSPISRPTSMPGLEEVIARVSFEDGMHKDKQSSNSEKEPTEVTINGVKYKVSDCTRVEDKWFLKTDETIAVNNYHKYEDREGWSPHDDTEAYYFKADMYAIVTDMQDGAPILEYSSRLGDNCVPLHPFSNYNITCKALYVCNYEFGKSHFIEDPVSSSFVHSKAQLTTKKLTWQKKSHMFKSDHDGIAATSETFLKTEGKRYTFGVELECCGGVLPRYYANYHKLDVSCVFDGSLRMRDNDDNCGEYVTGVLCGDRGFYHLHQIVRALAVRCKVNHKCSVHVHVGGMTVNQEFTVNMYHMLMILEKELFAMMPPSRRNNEYCSKITPIKSDIKYNTPSWEVDIREAYQEIIKIVSMQSVLQTNINKHSDHPKGYHCHYDRSSPRYWWANFVPMLFNIRKNGVLTLEFRNHSGSLNYTKISNWVLICLGLVWFVENKSQSINKKLTLRDVLLAAYPKHGEKLAEYVDKRKKLFTDGTGDSENSDYEDNTNKDLKLKEVII